MKNVCCFTGHRPKTLPFLEKPKSKEYKKLREIIKNHIESLIENNVDTFLTGMAIGVDMLCAEIVLELKKKKPYIKLNCALPCPDQNKYWTDSQSKKYLSILDKADDVKYITSYYSPYSMQMRNKYMVNQSDFVIAIWNFEKTGGTWNTINYAEKQNNKDIIFIDTNKL